VEEWRIGPLRIINHGGYAAVAALVYIGLINAQLGPGLELLMVSIFLCGIIGAALWAQWVEAHRRCCVPWDFMEAR